jgi:serine/threonine-protein kinase
VPDVYAAQREKLVSDAMLGRMIDGHVVVGPLGKGGFGRVYLGIQTLSRLKVAIKMLHPQVMTQKQEALARRNFEREALAMASLTHPAIVRLYRYGFLDDLPYLIMEYMEESAVTRLDDDMRRRFDSDDWYSIEEIRSILSQLLFALEHAHEKGIIHRDLKPSNIMLQRTSNDPMMVRVFDFGLAKDLELGEQTEHIIGTPSYMSPEQIRGKKIGITTDLYAVAVIAIELLTGRKPFPHGGHQAVFAAKLDAAYDPTEVLEHIQPPQSVRAFFRRALSVKPTERSQSAKIFREALDPLFNAIGPLEPGTPDISRVTTEPVFAEDRRAIVNWLEREEQRLRLRKGKAKDWDEL